MLYADNNGSDATPCSVSLSPFDGFYRSTTSGVSFTLRDSGCPNPLGYSSTDYKNQCYPLDNLELNEILPIIKNCNIAVCNDSSFSHLSSGLGIKTIVLMADTPLLYGDYSTNMYPIIPDGENTVTHNTLGKERINPNKILEQFKKILN